MFRVTAALIRKQTRGRDLVGNRSGVSFQLAIFSNFSLRILGDELIHHYASRIVQVNQLAGYRAMGSVFDWQPTDTLVSSVLHQLNKII